MTYSSLLNPSDELLFPQKYRHSCFTKSHAQSTLIYSHLLETRSTTRVKSKYNPTEEVLSVPTKPRLYTLTLLQNLRKYLQKHEGQNSESTTLMGAEQPARQERVSVMVTLFCDTELNTLARIQGDNTNILLGWLWKAWRN